MKIIITLPAYNEEKTIGKVIKDIHTVMKPTEHKHKYKVLVVDDGSKDRTISVAKNAGSTVFPHPYNYGLAETFRTEMKCVKGKADIIVHIDADGQYEPKEIPKLIEPILKKEADLVLGSRFAGKIEKMPLMKKLGNIAFSKVISQITKVKISDGQTGFRAFTREVAEEIKITSTHTYTQEMIIRAVKQRFRIKEVPVHFYERTSGKSRLLSNPFDYAGKAWLNLFRIFRDFAPLKFFGFIGFSFLGISFLIGLYLTYAFFILGPGISGKVPSILLMLLLFLTGIQIIIFGFLADMQKK